MVVTAGPTRESIDPVRVVTNRSSGKMGYRHCGIGVGARRRGGTDRGAGGVAGPIGVTVTRVETTKDLERAVAVALPSADVLVMAAAPADFRPASPSPSKQPRTDGARVIPMEPTDDILGATEERRKPGSLIVGFALETGDAVAKARAKLERKHLDLIVVNDALEPGAGFEHDTNRVALLDREGGMQILPLQSKRQVAEAILERGGPP